MRKSVILKIILVLVIGMVFFARPINLFAASSDATDLNNYWDDWEDQGSKDDLTTEETEETEEVEEETVTTTPSTTTPTTQVEEEETLPHAGVAEDTMMVIIVVALGAVAVYTFKKVNEYNNI